ncbi:anti-sigma factor [Kitasatospora sp. NBC_01287]|uniref:anti-sigma factor n=1 Tax=Kitasatospora sp. NBC_01287 TaxID=2903573 RepID=UPI00224DFAFC|nr:anti-sigma factor [Kitasatospora sp. NBC_01287]MCX4751637.1 anti-sigma factor [Kitasatospora sp. NBC_01287]
MTSTADLHTLTGAYAAHALAEAECRAFERHLAQCDACALEVREFSETLARLGAAEVVAPPPELRIRVLAATATTRQLPPLAAAPVAADQERGRRVRRWPRFALAASVAVAAALGGIAVQQHERASGAAARADRLQVEQDRIAGLLTAPDARTSSRPLGSGAGTVIWSQSRGQAGFLAQGLPALAQGRTYELWYDDGGTMRPAGLLPTATGALLLTGPIHGAAGVGVTVEPAGGSARPSGQPVLVLPFS